MTVRYNASSNLPIARGFCAADIDTVGGKLNLCVTDEVNQNLTASQKLLLKWHFKLGHLAFQHVQWLARQGYLPAKISTVDVSTIKCASCRFGAAHKIPTGKSNHTILPKSEGGGGSIKANDLKPGDRVSVDHFESRVRGHL